MTHSSPPLAPPSATASAAATSTVEAVFSTILRDIVDGTYAPGARLPAERELARALGASRPTLREALRRLVEWRLIEPRRGSGVVVRPETEWSIEVLPAYLRFGKPPPGHPGVGQMFSDLLMLRRSVYTEIARMAAGRVPPGGTAGARAAARRAWASRSRPGAFPHEDLQVMRSLVDAAGLLPALWLLNRLAGVYLDISTSLAGAFQPPADYLVAHETMLAAVERGDGAAAATTIDGYFARHDALIARFLGASQSSDASQALAARPDVGADADTGVEAAADISARLA